MGIAPIEASRLFPFISLATVEAIVRTKHPEGNGVLVANPELLRHSYGVVLCGGVDCSCFKAVLRVILAHNDSVIGIRTTRLLLSPRASGGYLMAPARCILHRPEDPVAFCRDLLNVNIDARGGIAVPYDPSCAPRLLKVCTPRNPE